MSSQSSLLEQLKRYLELANKATPGPWDETWLYLAMENEDKGDNNKRDAAFIAASRTMGPALAKALIRAVEALNHGPIMKHWCPGNGESGVYCAEKAFADIEKILEGKE